MAQDDHRADDVDELGQALAKFYKDHVEPDVIANAERAVKDLIKQEASHQETLRQQLQNDVKATLASIQTEMKSLRATSTKLESTSTNLQKNEPRTKESSTPLKIQVSRLEDLVNKMSARIATPAVAAESGEKIAPVAIAEPVEEAAPEAIGELPVEPEDPEGDVVVTPDTVRPPASKTGRREGGNRSLTWMKTGWSMFGGGLLIGLAVGVAAALLATSKPSSDPAPAVTAQNPTSGPGDPSEARLQRGWDRVLAAMPNAGACSACDDFSQVWNRARELRPSHQAILQTALQQLGQDRPDCNISDVAVTGYWNTATRTAAIEAATCIREMGLAPQSDAEMPTEALRRLTEAILRTIGETSDAASDSTDAGEAGLKGAFQDGGDNVGGGPAPAADDAPEVHGETKAPAGNG